MDLSAFTVFRYFLAVTGVLIVIIGYFLVKPENNIILSVETSLFQKILGLILMITGSIVLAVFKYTG